MKHSTTKTAYYHLPGLFEFYDLYSVFLPLFYSHREYFYDWCDIASVYGAPADCIWGGGRVESGNQNPREVFALMREYGISARLTFSNSQLEPVHHLDDAGEYQLMSADSVSHAYLIADDQVDQVLWMNLLGWD